MVDASQKNLKETYQQFQFVDEDHFKGRKESFFANFQHQLQPFEPNSGENNVSIFIKGLQQNIVRYNSCKPVNGP